MTLLRGFLASGGVDLRTVRRKRAKYQLIDCTTIYTTTYNGDDEVPLCFSKYLVALPPKSGESRGASPGGLKRTAAATTIRCKWRR
jgi:hypothetical protein